jgi:hypothetical protein
MFRKEYIPVLSGCNNKSVKKPTGKQAESKASCNFLLDIFFPGCLFISSKEEKRNAYRLLIGKPEGKRPLGRPRRR